MGEIFGGRYELVDPIGSGGMGAVWRVRDRRTGRFLAAKVLRQSDADGMLRFVREQSRRIDHPHVLAPRSWVAEDDRLLFTMDLMRGGSVATLLGDHGPLPAPYAAVLLDQILAALAAVHAAGIVHRDVKPANLLLEVTGRGRPHVRLSDFGIAVRAGEPRLTASTAVVGTPGYLSPEQLALADPSPAQDLYAAGVTGLELLTGSPEVGRASTVPPGVPQALWALLRELTDPLPSRRPATAEAARRQLGASGLVPPPGSEPWRAVDDPPEVFDHLSALPQRRRPARTAALAVAAVAAVVGLAVLGAWGLGALDDQPRPDDPADTTPTALDPTRTPTATTATTTDPTAESPTRASDTGGPAAGDACLFSDIGSREQGPDGAVECRLVDGTYIWTRPQ